MKDKGRRDYTLNPTPRGPTNGVQFTDAYVRYHQTGRGGVGFTLTWSHAATDAHIERIATLISGSLWASESGAPFTCPFTVRTGAPEVAARPGRAPLRSPFPTAPETAEPHTSTSGTGIFVTNEGRLITNAHVVKDCLEIRVGMGQGSFEAGKLVAKDPTNDLALLKVNAKPARVGALRFGARQGENVEAFGYPLSQVLATSGNFTTGIVTALAGIGDDSRFYQISAPVQPGNSGGPLLDENGNLIGVVSSKLNFLSEIKSARRYPVEREFRDQGLRRRQLPSGQHHQVPDRRGDAGDERARPGRRGESSQRVHRVPLKVGGAPLLPCGRRVGDGAPTAAIGRGGASAEALSAENPHPAGFARHLLPEREGSVACLSASPVPDAIIRTAAACPRRSPRRANETVQQMRVGAHAHAKLWAGAGKRALDDLGDPNGVDACLDPPVEEAAGTLTTFRVGANARRRPPEIAPNLGADEARLDQDRTDAEGTDLIVQAFAIAFKRVLGGAVEGLERAGQEAGYGPDRDEAAGLSRTQRGSDVHQPARRYLQASHDARLLAGPPGNCRQNWPSNRAGGGDDRLRPGAHTSGRDLPHLLDQTGRRACATGWKDPSRRCRIIYLTSESSIRYGHHDQDQRRRSNGRCRRRSASSSLSDEAST